MKQFKSKRSAYRRTGARVVLGRAAAAGGIVAVGAAFGLALSLPSAGIARAGEHNYVRSSSHEQISNVRLDEEVTILFNSALLPSSVGPDTINIRTGPTNGIQAQGTYSIGAFMYDRSAQRRVVIRPTAIQEYYQLKKGYPREDATRLATKLIRSIESSGRISQLNKIDRALVSYFGASYFAGTRLDDEFVLANYPPPLGPADSLRIYREKIAGDDVKWQAYQYGYLAYKDPDAWDRRPENSGLTPEDLAAKRALVIQQAQQFFKDLGANPEYERFYHRRDPVTGQSSSLSVLRTRDYRRVLINRRAANKVLFIPEIPIRADLTDTGYRASSSYTIIIPSSQPGVFNTVLTRSGARPLP